jgi:hypothetical protein
MPQSRTYRLAITLTEAQLLALERALGASAEYDWVDRVVGAHHTKATAMTRMRTILTNAIALARSTGR